MKAKRDKANSARMLLAERLDSLADELSPEEVRQTLQVAGYDPQASWERFVKKAKDLESDTWAKGKEPSIELRRLVKHANDPENAQMGRAEGLLETLAARLRFGFSVPANLEVVHAYRKSGELSDADSAVLDELEKELRAKLADDGKSGS